MAIIVWLLASASLLLSFAFYAPFSPNVPVISRNILVKSAEPNAGDDLPVVEPHPDRYVKKSMNREANILIDGWVYLMGEQLSLNAHQKEILLAISRQ